MIYNIYIYSYFTLIHLCWYRSIRYPSKSAPIENITSWSSWHRWSETWHVTCVAPCCPHMDSFPCKHELHRNISQINYKTFEQGEEAIIDFMFPKFVFPLNIVVSYKTSGPQLVVCFLPLPSPSRWPAQTQRFSQVERQSCCRKWPNRQINHNKALIFQIGFFPPRFIAPLSLQEPLNLHAFEIASCLEFRMMSWCLKFTISVVAFFLVASELWGCLKTFENPQKKSSKNDSKNPLETTFQF